MPAKSCMSFDTRLQSACNVAALHSTPSMSSFSSVIVSSLFTGFSVIFMTHFVLVYVGYIEG